jgi:hypothetical protein
VAASATSKLIKLGILGVFGFFKDVGDFGLAELNQGLCFHFRCLIRTKGK